MRIAPPRLLIDGGIAALPLLAIAFFARFAMLPDSVAYFENAELFAHGRWAAAVQGYWSPGYSLLLVPAAWLAGDDRAALLAIAHVVQALLGIAALWLAIVAIRRRVPAGAQRAVFWGCAWVILRWLTQEFLTPDLLLCVLLLLFIGRLPARGKRDEIWLGVIAGAGFIVKTSSWPWLAAGAAFAALRHARNRDWRAFPSIAFGTGTAIVAAFVLALSSRAGHPTLGGVGPLNARWYLGDLTRRTPDTDNGPHAAKRLSRLPNGATLPVYDFRPGTRTYAPWSDPEAWARGVPTESQPRLNAAQMAKSWKQNLGESLRWLLPIAVGLVLFLVWSGDSGPDSGWWSSALDRPLLLVGAAAALMFLAVHAEHRLLAPAALLALLGSWRDAGAGMHRPRARLAWLSRATVASVAVSVALYMATFTENSIANAVIEERFDRFFDAQVALNPAPGVVIVGPADRWMGLLWRHHLRVDVQIGGAGELPLRTLADQQRLQWLRDSFGAGTLGVGDSSLRREGDAAGVRLRFTTW